MTPDEIKLNTDLSEYIREQGLELTKHGTHDLKCLCPFHEDTNPSLIISPKKKLFNCPVCATGGSVIDFAMKFHNLELPQALKQLEERLTGNKQVIVIDSDGGRTIEKPRLSPDKEAQLLERVVTFYEKAMVNNPDGAKYLNERGITDSNIYTKHRIGFADGSLLKALPKDGEILEELEILGVLIKNKRGYSERFRNCVVFPVFDIHGNITTLYGRHTNPNSKKRHIYLPDRPTGLWNVQCIKSYNEVALVESVIDALSLEMAGINNAVSVQGTNGLKGTDLDQLKENGIKHVDVIFDADDAGKKASDKLYSIIYNDKSFESYSYFFLADANDPNEYLLKYGSDRLGKHIRYQSERQRIYNAEGADNSVVQTKNGFTIRLSFAYEVSGLDKAPRRLRATIRVESKGLFHIDTVDLYSSRQRRTFAQDICRIFEAQPDVIESDILKIVKVCEGTTVPDSGSSPDEEQTEIVISPKDREEATAFGRSSEIVDKILSDFETCGLVGETSNKLLGYLAMTSRKMDDPLSILILSSSGAGKSALQDTTLNFCPPEDLVKLTNLSGKALFYKDSNSLKHKVLALEEGAGAEDASYAIRNLISADGLTTESTVRDPQTGRLTTMENKVEGPTAVFCTTTQPDVDPETKSRFIVTGIDESREQTRRILHFQRKRHSVDGLKKDLQADNVTRKHRNFQRLLRPLKVVNPFAEKLRYEDDRLQGRRAQPQYLALINAMAFLRQMCKQSHKVKMPDGEKVEYIEVDRNDIKLANGLALEVLGKSLDELSIPARNLLILLDEMLEKKQHALCSPEKSQDEVLNEWSTKRNISFTRREIREQTGWSNYRVHTHLKELITMDYVVVDAGRGTSLQSYKLAYDGQGQDGSKFITGLIDVEKVISIAGVDL